MTRLELRDVRKNFGALEVLSGISMTVDDGEFVSILGPSGAGKSTLLQLLTGAIAGEGEMRFDGAPLDDHGRHFAFMPQRDALMPWRRVIDNAALGLEVQGMRRRAARERVAPLFAEFGLAGFERAWPAELSGGMRQRAALLRTVVQQRDMLLLDEPFGALDALTRTAMQRWLEKMWASHRWTALLITHDVREAVLLSDRIYVLSERPARVVAEVAVPLPRPRTESAALAREAAAIEASILDTLLGAGRTEFPIV
ncbi:ABC transporter ATP-binding protein [Mesorhizobium sp. B2-4-12]|uniref:ABC transporter ATP-binding protein n=1 Tax=unclassified Mesorhizobium TaxID=325217 RepID=UPI00112ED8DC|nr:MULTISPECIES: ABC transporter ATP-binding protein [unclassified Mesorhizobium]TPK96380.1 ABC transporter ATP-binding protein [Mesorhizobium sp. B2-4-12]UCI34226.1 ABC transporter ATP-binding protein [Mesorhizobium sp. B4-1-4]